MMRVWSELPTMPERSEESTRRRPSLRGGLLSSGYHIDCPLRASLTCRVDRPLLARSATVSIRVNWGQLDGLRLLRIPRTPSFDLLAISGEGAKCPCVTPSDRFRPDKSMKWAAA